jgi:hypothetical protein
LIRETKILPLILKNSKGNLAIFQIMVGRLGFMEGMRLTITQQKSEAKNKN